MLPDEFKQVFRVTLETFVTYVITLCYFVMKVVKFKYKKLPKQILVLSLHKFDNQNVPATHRLVAFTLVDM